MRYDGPCFEIMAGLCCVVIVVRHGCYAFLLDYVVGVCYLLSCGCAICLLLLLGVVECCNRRSVL